jgi:hypothetical protein
VCAAPVSADYDRCPRCDPVWTWAKAEAAAFPLDHVAFLTYTVEGSQLAAKAVPARVDETHERSGRQAYTVLKGYKADPRAVEAILNIEGFRALDVSIIEAVVAKSEAVKKARRDKQESGENISKEEKKELPAEEKEYKSKRKQIQEKLIKFATRIPVFMYPTDYRENTLRDVITMIEPGLFRAVTGMTIADFELLVSLGVFSASQMNQAVFAFRRYEDASLAYTGLDSHPNLSRYGLYDTVVAQEVLAGSG